MRGIGYVETSLKVIIATFLIDGIYKCVRTLAIVKKSALPFFSELEKYMIYALDRTW
jgi:hypothetical protein